MIKKFLYLFGFFFSIIGGIGGLGYAIWLKEYGLTVGLAVLCYAAYPKVKEWITRLINE